MPDGITGAAQVIALMNTLAAERAGRVERRGEQALRFGMAQWLEEAQATQRVNELRIHSALNEQTRLSELRNALEQRVGDVAKLDTELKAIRERTPATDALLKSELDRTQQQNTTIAQRQETVDNLLNRLQAENVAIQAQTSRLSELFAAQATIEWERRAGLEERRVRASEAQALAAMRRAGIAEAEAIATSEPLKPLLDILGATEDIMRVTKPTRGIVGHKIVTEKGKRPTRVPIYGDVGGDPTTFREAKQIARPLLRLLGKMTGIEPPAEIIIPPEVITRLRKGAEVGAKAEEGTELKRLGTAAAQTLFGLEAQGLVR